MLPTEGNNIRLIEIPIKSAEHVRLAIDGGIDPWYRGQSSFRVRADVVEGFVNGGLLLILGDVAYGFGGPRDAIFELAGKLLAGLSGGCIVG
jgi:hypothetical protein